ncbi:type I-E CRISPR-associated protein Cse1/CasA [Spirochaeta cellobiosiphila]|uniref:type I-E CRISPR-associated protein Cse1/CasA n=1 Tax=Spirochaeta cellobiosiphila TaxID=504483 RepID=UPI0004280A49|nr:type I-E CRISPR-associated protein Cse1/CasA [Spirochaeta cellobiosiphila]
MNHHFNLIDEAWIPIADAGLVSLKEIFDNKNLKTIGGNAVQKISLLRFFLAIAQAACTPEDDKAWADLTSHGMAQLCLGYLDDKKELFNLYGDKPFLQMPVLKEKNTKIQPYYVLLPELASGNTTVLFDSQMDNEMTDAQKALLLLRIGGFATSGKQVDNTIILSSTYKGKTKDNGKATSGKFGPSLAFQGLQHHFWQGRTLKETIYQNLFTSQDIQNMGIFMTGLGIPPWEKMPESEDDDTAKTLLSSYLGRLMPLSRFVLLAESGVYYTEGLAYPNYAEGIWDPSIAIDSTQKKIKTLWVSTDKKPWRSISSFLSFLDSEKESFTNFQLKLPFRRIKKHCDITGIWAGGLKVSSNAGEQYCSGTDDYIASLILLDPKQMGGTWFPSVKSALATIDSHSKRLYRCLSEYNRSLRIDNKDKINKDMSLYWNQVELVFTKLIQKEINETDLDAFHNHSKKIVEQIYDASCPKQTARQLKSWAEHYPRIKKITIEEVKVG